MDAIVEIHALLSGTVQGVSCRINVKRIADRFKLSGLVKNLEDGHVEVIAIGEEATLRSFLKEIENLPYPIEIEKIETTFKPLSRKFEGRFEII